MRVESEFIAGAANTVAKGTVWLEMEDEKSILLYGIANVIGVADVDSQNVLCTLPGHQDRVTSLTKLNDFSTRASTDVLTPISVVSSSADGSVMVWEHIIGSPMTSWRVVAYLKIPESEGSITTHTSLSTTLGTLISASNSHGTLVTWFRPHSSCRHAAEHTTAISGNDNSCAQEGGGFVLKETLQMHAMHMPNDLMLMELPSAKTVFSPHQGLHSVLLVIGSVDSKVHLRLFPLVQADAATVETTNASGTVSSYTYGSATTSVGMLAGHDDWIRCLSGAAYVTDRESNVTSLFFASGSQDSKIRVWRITPTATQNMLKSRASEPSSTFSSELSTQEQEEEVEDDDEDDGGVGGEESIAEVGGEGSTEGISDEGLGEARCAFRCSSGLGSSSGSGSYTESESRYLVTLDALLVGHEDWVSSVHWVDSGVRTTVTPSSSTSVSARSAQSFYGPLVGKEESAKKLKLFSTSMDRNMVIWCPDEDSGIWLPTTRMGDIGGNLGGSVGGNLLGFVGSCIDLKSHSVLGVGYGGSFHLWQWRQEEGAGGSDKDRDNMGVGVGVENIRLHEQDEETSEAAALSSTHDNYAWRPVSFITGHFAAVRDVVWGYHQSCSASITSSPSSLVGGGSFLISVSADQTCRLFSPLTHPSSSSSSLSNRKWCELSRPQIHGYDLSCVQLAPLHTAPFTLYSGGDEKAVRIFEAPLVVAEGLVKLSENAVAQDYCVSSAPESVPNTISSGKSTFGLQHLQGAQKVHRAYIPELGLSNKPADLMSEEEVSEQASRGVDTSLWVSGPPLEGQLSDYTIWPEVKKLFGHVGDVVCLSASPCGRWIASAGKGRDAASSSIRLWETRRMICVAILAGHESTVTALRFSPDSKYLISGGKDRSLHVYKHNPAHEYTSDASAVSPFLPHAYLNKAHKRIIWDVAWVAVEGKESGVVFASVSRDGAVKVWSLLAPGGGGGGREGDSKLCTLVCLTSLTPFVGSIAVTAVDVTASLLTTEDCHDDPGYLLAFGAESGALQLWFLSAQVLFNAVRETYEGNGVNEKSVLLQQVYSVAAEHCHGAAVRRLRWCDCDAVSGSYCEEKGEAGLKMNVGQRKLASCGDDHCVRVFNVTP